MRTKKHNKTQKTSIFNKKGVSPLIATVLLIAFAVALGAVVMNWGRQYVEDTTKFTQEKSNKEIKCSIDVGLKFSERSDGNKFVCFNATSGEINFTIENGQSTDISALQVKVFSASGDVNTTILDVALASADAKRLGLTYPTSFGNLSKIEIVPQISLQGAQKTAFCQKSSITEVNPLQC